MIVAGRARHEPDGTLTFGGANALLLSTCDDAELRRMRKAMIAAHIQAAGFGAVFAAASILASALFGS